MLALIDKASVSLDNNVLVTEASTAGLRPGEWPLFVAVGSDVSPDPAKGWEGAMFTRGSMLSAMGSREFEGYEYTSAKGHRLLIYND